MLFCLKVTRNNIKGGLSGFETSPQIYCSAEYKILTHIWSCTKNLKIIGRTVATEIGSTLHINSRDS